MITKKAKLKYNIMIPYQTYNAQKEGSRRATRNFSGQV